MNLKNLPLPEYNNFHSFFRGTSKQEIAEKLLQNGWTGRKSKWGEWDLRNDWSELTLEGEGEEPLLNGSVVFNPENIQLLHLIFDSIKCEYAYEFSDEKKNVLLEKRLL